HLTNFLVGLRTDPRSPLLPAPYVHYLQGDEITLAELFNRQGYKTGIVGKWHLGNEDSVSAYAQGFIYDRVIGKNGLDYYNYSIVSRNKEIFVDKGQEYLTDKLTEYALEFIGNNKDGPFFLYLAYSAPHVLVVPKPDKLAKYLFQYNNFNGKFNPYYAAVLESLDEGIGRIMEKLNSLDLEKNTLVIFTSDNGGLGIDELGPVPTNNLPLRGWKGDVYEGGIRVPLIISWPEKVPEHSTNINYVTGTDFLQTFMELTGYNNLPENLDGISFLRSIFSPEEKFDRGPVYWHYPHFSNQRTRPAGAVRFGDFKVVERYETGTIELYDLRNDLSESHDISAEHPEKTKELSDLLRQWRAAVNANMPLHNPEYQQNR
ncbi:MAG TPA: sulfatase-like hydrolase/transferase, partial [Cyclobacteriaceae bacterium]|nr:sulfatase-like hydrolase/transferase [Cyclobacteriaceae bacterium]